jgi:hypothetical protein
MPGKIFEMTQDEYQRKVAAEIARQFETALKELTELLRKAEKKGFAAPDLLPHIETAQHGLQDLVGVCRGMSIERGTPARDYKNNLVGDSSRVVKFPGKPKQRKGK